MAGSFWAEVLKLRKRTAVWVLGILWLAVVVLFLYLLPALIFAAIAANAPPELQAGLEARTASLRPENLAAYLPSSPLFQNVGPAIAIILGAITAGSEYGWGTLKSVLAQGPGRLVVLLGKLLVLGALLLLFVLAAFLVGAVSSLVVALFQGASLAPPSASSLLGGLAAGALILIVWAAFGFALSTLFRSTALGLALGLIYALAIEPVFAGLSPLDESLRAISRFLPSVNTQAVRVLATSEADNLSLQQNFLSPALAALVLLLYAAVFVFVTALVFRQRDVT